ncbi:hypothetical protein GCM10023184_29290 [Flaviaesturariibacter amylovorans]|uniref:PD-(D/E)XK nuclease superfamily protein n=2 Tax=Flaviaesturariibacter amylovorans TaxID=1084520 RepID=A0ABP8H635_9BACT
MISKYSRLAFAYILEQYARAIAHVDETGLSDREKEQAFRTFNQLERLDVALGELGLVDVEDQAVFREVYQAQAQALIDGLIRPLGQFDGLLRGFIEAQQDYQLFLEALLDLWEGGERSPDRKIRDAFARHDIDGGIVLLNAVIAKVPYYLLRFDREAAYHLIVHLTLILVGCDIQSEVAVLRGRIDARLELENCVYLMEFKLQDAATAIRQILDRGYALPEGLHTKPVFALGLVFDTKHRRIAPEYELRPIDSTRS